MKEKSYYILKDADERYILSKNEPKADDLRVAGVIKVSGPTYLLEKVSILDLKE